MLLASTTVAAAGVCSAAKARVLRYPTQTNLRPGGFFAAAACAADPAGPDGHEKRARVHSCYENYEKRRLWADEALLWGRPVSSRVFPA